MARSRTAEEIVLDIRRRAGQEGSGDDFATDDEILEEFNQQWAEVRGHLRMNEGQPHKRLTANISVVSGTTLYDLPADYWELLGVTASINGLVRDLEPFMEGERGGLSNGNYYASVVSPMYRIANDQIEILPSTQNFTLTVRYAPSEGRIRLGRVPPDTIDGYNGYEVAAIYGTVAMLQEKEQLDPSFYEGRKMRILQHIDALAAKRDAARPERVTDVTGDLDNGPFGYGW
jgi:hypothetical protein